MIVVSHDIGHWVAERTGGIYTPQNSHAIGRMDGSQIIGGVSFSEYSGRSIAMHCAGEGHWLSRELLFKAFWYPFSQLKVNKVIGLVDSTNTQAIKLDEHLGFVLEAVIKDAAPVGDWLIYSMTREQCRFLGAKYESWKK